jgi:hypothetical protein
MALIYTVTRKHHKLILTVSKSACDFLTTFGSYTAPEIIYSRTKAELRDWDYKKQGGYGIMYTDYQIAATNLLCKLRDKDWDVSKLEKADFKF